MGCGDSREKIEDEMIKLKFERAQIQMERKKQIQILEGIERKKITEPIIPDYISLKPEKPFKNVQTEIKNKSVSDKNKKAKKKSPVKKKKPKSDKTKKPKHRKTDSTKQESQKNDNQS
jgi:hypothetical protein